MGDSCAALVRAGTGTFVSDSHSRTFTDSYSRDINVFGPLDFVFNINSVVCVST